MNFYLISIRRFILFLFSLFLLFPVGINPLLAFDHRHQLWQQILRSSVHEKERETKVDYKGIKDSKIQRKKLQDYILQIESVQRKDFDQWSKQQQLAFLINAYNALTVELIVRNYPLESIRDLGGLFSSAWKEEFFQLFGKKSHLDFIEHDFIRVHYKEEPRIHFALVCAAKGCPPLRKQVYQGSRLEEQLQAAAENFLGNKSKNYYSPKNNTLYLSSIFKWYGKDFEQKVKGVKTQTLENYLSKFRNLIPSEALAEQLRKNELEIDYLEYDWQLNQWSPPDKKQKEK